MKTVAYKLIAWRASWGAGAWSDHSEAEAELNKLAEQGWRVIGFVSMGEQSCMWTLERADDEAPYR